MQFIKLIASTSLREESDYHHEKGQKTDISDKIPQRWKGHREIVGGE